MPCYHPWRTEKGDVVRCGQCRGCRSARAREWSMRCMHEASLHEDNSFLTLTYEDKYLPPGGSLDREAFPLFMKRLRRAIEPQRVRYFHVGEYGENSNRPHYHALLFGWEPVDKVLLTVRKGFPVFTSELLRKAWPWGLHEVGCVTPASAGYVTRYIQHRITGSWAKAKYGSREPEYGTMSRTPGIGAGWIDKFRCEVYPSDGVVVRGSVVKPPRYYDIRCERVSPADMDVVKLKRFEKRKREEETPERLLAAEKVQAARESLIPGGGL